MWKGALTLGNFAVRLKTLRVEKKLRQSDLAAELGLARTTIANYEQATRFPDEQALHHFADYFDVSLDYLLGRTEFRTTEHQELFTNNPAILLLIDPQTSQLVDFSTTAVAFYGYPRKELLKKKITDLNILPEAEVVQYMGLAIAEQQRHFYFHHRLANGEIRDVEVFSGPIVIDHRRLLYSVVHDLTNRSQIQEKITRTLESIIVTIVNLLAPFRAQHEKRVADLACAIGKELKLPSEQISVLRMAAFAHDVGMLNIPPEILNKPGKIRPVEFQMIREHSHDGYLILKQIQFEDPIAEITLQHHERLNGTGYPQGLIGEDIRIEARIIAVADVVEAMCSHRPYRPAPGLAAALAELRSGSGTLYDPDVVQACISLFREERFTF